jgi:hypothetical protein
VINPRLLGLTPSDGFDQPKPVSNLNDNRTSHVSAGRPDAAAITRSHRRRRRRRRGDRQHGPRRKIPGRPTDGPPAYEMLFRACIAVTGLSKLATEIEARLQLEGVQP